MVECRDIRVRLQPPSPFYFKTSDERKFEQFRLASGLAGESDDRQISTLLYCIEEEADYILASTNIADADRRKYSAVIKAYNDFAQVRKNVIFEKARFNCRCQALGESVKRFITSLYALEGNGDYGDLKDQMIRCSLSSSRWMRV